MLELDWQVRARGGVALVELVVSNPTATARRVRVANRLDGPVWPPRREGVPAAGWDDGGFEGVVAPGDRRALGYASPVSASVAADTAGRATDTAGRADTAEPLPEPPAELVWSERAGASEADDAPSDGFTASAGDGPADEPTPEGVVRALGDARPPADAVPSPESRPEIDSENAPTGRSP